MQKPFFGEAVTGRADPTSCRDLVEAEGGEREMEVAVLGVEDESVGDATLAYQRPLPAALWVNSCCIPW